MKRFAKLLMVALAFGVLGFAMSLVPQKNATGAGGAPVNIASPLPLPVTGNVDATVAGTVGISGTPTVDIGTMPTVTLGNATVNTASTAGRNIVRLLGSSGSSPFLNDLNGSQFQVPSGKRLVINFGSIIIDGPSGFTPAVQLLVFQALSGGTDFQLNVNFPLTKLPSTPGGGDSYVATVQGPLYIDQNLPVVAEVANATSWQAFLQGYLVDCGAGCTQ